MKKSNFAVALILIISVILFTLGVIKKNSSNVQDAKIIAVIPKGTASMWWEVVHKGALEAGRQRGYEIIWTGPEQETDREKQIQAVDDVVVKGVDAVVLGPNDAKALVRPVQKLKEKGIPCVIIDSAVEAAEEDYVSFVATDNFAGGADAAKRLGATLNGRGNVIIAKFVQNSASTDARALGFKDTLAKEYPGIKIIDEQFSLGTVEDSRQKTVDMLTRNPNVSGLYAVNHPASVGAFKALQAQQLAGKIVMVGFDSDPILLEGIAAGEVEALIVQNPFEIGFQGVMIAVDTLEGISCPKKKPINSMIVDKNNLEEMKQKFPAALGL
ncbi:MAG: substrate-binding domain-containing protein [Phycisphaerae bacterium]|nr:substrate-binding domain-containing protein [Phycisphaerae bacterium]